jgi:hypothetical protein
MERPNMGLSLASLAAGMNRMTGGAGASMMAFRDAMLGQDAGLSRGNRIGPGRRSVWTLHRKIRADAERDTPGAQRMRDVVARRAANWAR